MRNKKALEQVQLCIGVPAHPIAHEKRHAGYILNTLLGGGMSSRLFQVIREQHGLAYSIQSSTSYFADTGAFVISAGLDTKRLSKALRLVLRELKKIARRPPAADELRRAKDYSIGQMRLGLESTSNQMMWIGEHILAYGFIHTPEEIEKRIEAVTPEQIQSVAAAMFRDNHLSAAVITPSKEERAVEDLLSFS